VKPLGTAGDSSSLRFVSHQFFAIFITLAQLLLFVSRAAWPSIVIDCVQVLLPYLLIKYQYIISVVSSVYLQDFSQQMGRRRCAPDDRAAGGSSSLTSRPYR
jgi:hypothetical protein